MKRLKRNAQAVPSKSMTTTLPRSGGRPTANVTAETMISTDQARSANATLRRTTLTAQTNKLHATELAKAAKLSCKTGMEQSINQNLSRTPE